MPWNSWISLYFSKGFTKAWLYMKVRWNIFGGVFLTCVWKYQIYLKGAYSYFQGGRSLTFTGVELQSQKKILHIFNKLKRENCLECRKYECVCQRKIFLRTLFGLKSWKRQHSRKESLPRPDHKEYRYVREERDYYTDKKSTSMVIKRFTTQCFPIHYPRFKTKKNPERQQSILS